MYDQAIERETQDRLDAARANRLWEQGREQEAQAIVDANDHLGKIGADEAQTEVAVTSTNASFDVEQNLQELDALRNEARQTALKVFGKGSITKSSFPWHTEK